MTTDKNLLEIYQKLSDKFGITLKDVHLIHMHTIKCIRFCFRNVLGKVLIRNFGVFNPSRYHIERLIKLYLVRYNKGLVSREKLKKELTVLFHARRTNEYIFKRLKDE